MGAAGSSYGDGDTAGHDRYPADATNNEVFGAGRPVAPPVIGEQR